jgi:acyl dehydratase
MRRHIPSASPKLKLAEPLKVGFDGVARRGGCHFHDRGWDASREPTGRHELYVAQMDSGPAPSPDPQEEPLMSHAESALARFEKHIGNEEGVGEWMQVDQARINQFADATLDHQFIHIDPEKSAKLSPYKVTIAHGFLTLSLLPHLGSQIPPVDPKAYAGIVMGVNYGLDKVRFPAPVKVDARIRARRSLASVERKAPNTLQLKQVVTIEIEGEAKPGCVAESLSRLIYSD